MMKAKSLICHKMGYDPDKRQKSKLVEVEEDGAKQTFVVPILSGEEDLEFTINKQILSHKELASALNCTGLEKFHNFGQYCSGAYEATWENELAQNFRTILRTNPAFDRALVGTWIHVYGQVDLRKAALKMISKLKWKKVLCKYEHARPRKIYTSCGNFVLAVREDGRRSRHNTDADSAPKEGNVVRCLSKELSASLHMTFVEVSSQNHLQKLSKLWKIILIVSKYLVQARATANHLMTARRVAVLQTEVIALTAKGRRNTNPKNTKNLLSIPEREQEI